MWEIVSARGFYRLFVLQTATGCLLRATTVALTANGTVTEIAPRSERPKYRSLTTKQTAKPPHCHYFHLRINLPPNHVHYDGFEPPPKFRTGPQTLHLCSCSNNKTIFGKVCGRIHLVIHVYIQTDQTSKVMNN